MRLPPRVDRQQLFDRIRNLAAAQLQPALEWAWRQARIWWAESLIAMGLAAVALLTAYLFLVGR